MALLHQEPMSSILHCAYKVHSALVPGSFCSVIDLSEAIKLQDRILN